MTGLEAIRRMMNKVDGGISVDMGKEIVRRAVKAFESAIYYANEVENYRAFAHDFGEGESLIRLATDYYDFSIEDQDYVRELISMCEDIYSTIELSMCNL